MSSPLRPPLLEEVLKKTAPGASGRELLINPDGGMFDARNLQAAIRRAGHDDVIILPPGEYAAFELKKPLRLRCQQPGTVVIRGTMVLRSEFACFSGIKFQAEAGQPAFRVEKGTVILQDGVISGEITAGAPGVDIRIFLSGCLAGRTDEGIVLSHQTLLEVSESRISDCRVGLALREGAVAALYQSRIESCLSTDESDPGAGIYAEKATLYCEGVALRENGVGIYLKDSPESHLLATLFQESKVSALIVANGTASSTLHLHSCVATRHRSAECPQFSLTGGVVRMTHCRLDAPPSPALVGELLRLEMRDCSLTTRDATAVDLNSCHLTADSVTVQSIAGSALTASGCQGELRNSRLFGRPPTKVTSSAQLLWTDNTLAETAPETPTPEGGEPGHTIESVIRYLKDRIVQESVRSDFERIVRLAHAGQQRKEAGLPITDRHFHCVFMGPPGTGKLAAAGVLAQSLFAFDAIANPRVVEMRLDDLETSAPAAPAASAALSPPEAGVIFLRVHEATPPTDTVRRHLTRWLEQSDIVIILEGDRDALRRVLRSVPGLERMFRKTLFFTRYGPIELAAHFAKLSEADQIVLSPRATQTLLAILHYYCERKDKRFAHTTGVEMLYENSRHRFLERCSLANRMDLPLEARDLDIPQDATLQAALERSPAFVTWCPHCQKENPWLPELAPDFVCLHCDTPYSAAWGTWKEAAAYRQIRDSFDSKTTQTPVTFRSNLPARSI